MGFVGTFDGAWRIENGGNRLLVGSIGSIMRGCMGEGRKKEITESGDASVVLLFDAAYIVSD